MTWQINANAMYQAPCGIEVSGNVFGRQGWQIYGARHNDRTPES